MRKRIERRSKVSKVVELIDELESISADNGERFLQMTDLELDSLLAFDEDGQVCMYEVGGVLLGKNALLRWVECHKNVRK